MYHVIAPSPGLRTEKARPLMLNMFRYPNTCQSGSVHHCRGNPIRWKALGIHHGGNRKNHVTPRYIFKTMKLNLFWTNYVYIYTRISFIQRKSFIRCIPRLSTSEHWGPRSVAVRSPSNLRHLRRPSPTSGGSTSRFWEGKPWDPWDILPPKKWDGTLALAAAMLLSFLASLILL